MNIQEMEQAALRASSLLKALSNEKRLLILCQLSDGEKSVGRLADLLGLNQSPLSQHLARLRAEGLVETRREAQTIYYALHSQEAARVIELLYAMYCAPQTTD